MALTATAEVFKVKGSVVDADGDGEIYATVRVYADSDTAKPVAMDVTDLRGDFNLSLSGAGRYRLNVSSVGKVTAWRAFSVTDNEPMAVLDTIVTEISENVIGEVVVEAAKPLVAVEIDRITYDVAADMESAVSMVSGMLTKVPLVSVDADGTIKVNGSTSFRIYKNGRPNNTFSNNAKELFKALPAAMIQKIEVITDPGAREDAEGTSAILNIVTVKNAITKGITGNAEVSFNSKPTNIPTPHLWLTGQYGKLSVSVYGGGSLSSRGSSKSSAIGETEFLESGNRLVSSTGSSGRGQLGYWGVESSLDIDKRNLVTVEAGGFLSGNESRTWGESVMTDASGNMIYSYRSWGKNGPSRVRDFNGSVNYQHSTARDGETLTLSYRVSTGRNVSVSETEYTEMDDAPMDYTGIDADSRVRSMEHTVQADWSRQTGANGAIDAGGKYIYRDNRN
ncbi:MAG: TonB-dependent receptor family protein, partial [Muribaculaceae bacterium]|nr:TonB-dependent receptor family protein [Muribaculaceae bacterium]